MRRSVGLEYRAPCSAAGSWSSMRPPIGLGRAGF